MEGYFEHGIETLPEALKQPAKDLFSIAKQTSVCSLCSNGSNAMMWSLYAGENTGLCIEYDPKIMKSWLVNDHALLQVRYQEKPPVVFEGISNSILSLSQGNYEGLTRSMVGTKKTDWEREQEFRLIRSTDKHYFHHKSAIKSITMGAKLSNSDALYKIKSCAQKIEVPLYKAEISGYNFTRTNLYSPTKNSHPKPDDNVITMAKNFIEADGKNHDKIHAIADALSMAKADPYCREIIDFDYSTKNSNNDLLFVIYERKKPEFGDLAEYNRSKRMYFDLTDGKAVRSWDH